MKQLLVSGIMTAALMLAAPAALAATPPLVQQAIAAIGSEPKARYDLLYEDNETSITASIDPSKPPGQRVLLTDAGPLASREDVLAGIAQIDAEPMAEFWCHNFGKRLTGPIQISRRSAVSTIFTFKPAIDPEDDADDAKFMANVQGEIEIANFDARIIGFRLFAPKPFRPSLTVRINRFEFKAKCALASNGLSYAKSTETHILARAFFKNIEQFERRSISKVDVISDGS